MNTLAKILIASVVMCSTVATPVLANSLETAREECNSDDSNSVIRGCSTLLGMILSNESLSGQQKMIAAKVYFARGKAYAENSQPAQAIVDYSNALQHNPGHLGAYIKRGFIYFDQEKIDKAFKDFDQAAHLDPLSFHAIAFRGMTHAASGQHKQAIADFDRALKLKADAATRQLIEDRRAASIKVLEGQE